MLHCSPLLAMPFSDYTDAMGNIRLEMLSRNGSGVLAGIAPEIDPVTGVTVTLSADPDDLSDAGSELALSGEAGVERLGEAEVKELGRFYGSLANRETMPEDWSREDAGDLAHDLSRDIDRFTIEQAQSGGRLPIAEAAEAPQQQGQSAQRPQIIVVRPPRAPVDDVPILSSVQLGTIAIEVLKPEIKATPIVGTAYHEFRQFLLIEERRSASVIMYDQNAGNGILMTVEDTANNNHNPQDQLSDLPTARTGRRAPFFDDRPLSEVILDFMASKLAIIIYAILLVCWLVWRYVIRRYA